LAFPPSLLRTTPMSKSATPGPAPKAAAALIEQGLAHHRQGQLSLAMDRYTEVLRNDATNADALYYVAVVACQEGQFDQGIDLARRSLSFRGRQARAHNLIGKALHRQSEVKGALEAFDMALECDIDFAEAYANRANMLSELGRHNEALSSFDRAIALKPDQADDWSNRGLTLARLGRFDEAVASYDKALALEPEFALGHFNRAAALRDAGRFEEALAGYERALELAPEAPHVLIGRAMALKELGRLEDALESAERAAALEPDLPLAQTARAAVLVALGRTEEAQAARDQAAEMEKRAQETPAEETDDSAPA
jgi:tetratricopeptide (TPR) repeat protein